MSHRGSCHCGKVKFEFEGEVQAGMTCNCSICKRKGTVLTFVPADKFKLLSGQDALTDYQFGKKHLHHWFCSTCGVTSFAGGLGPGGAEMRAVNLRCVDGIELGKVAIKEYDGASR